MRLVILIALLAVTVTACAVGPDYSASREFHATVDSVELPTAVSKDNTLPARFIAELGDSDCYAFSRMEYTRTAGEIRIKMIGKFDDGNCDGGPARVNRVFNIAPPHAGDTFTLYVEQPDGSELVYTVDVVE